MKRLSNRGTEEKRRGEKWREEKRREEKRREEKRRGENRKCVPTDSIQFAGTRKENRDKKMTMSRKTD